MRQTASAKKAAGTCWSTGAGAKLNQVLAAAFRRSRAQWPTRAARCCSRLMPMTFKCGDGVGVASAEDRLLIWPSHVVGVPGYQQARDLMKLAYSARSWRRLAMPRPVSMLARRWRVFAVAERHGLAAPTARRCWRSCQHEIEYVSSAMATLRVFACSGDEIHRHRHHLPATMATSRNFAERT